MNRIGQGLSGVAPRFSALITRRPEKTSPVIRAIFEELERAKAGNPVVDRIDQHHMDVVITAPDPWRPMGPQNITVEVRTKGGVLIKSSDDNFAPKTSAQALLDKAREMVHGIFPKEAEPLAKSPTTPKDPEQVGQAVAPLLQHAVLESLGLPAKGRAAPPRLLG
jgi:hypothetical protein